MARVMPWRIHHVAYVENLNPRRQSNSSTARIRPMLPSWIRSSSGQALALVLAGHGHHQPQVGHDEPLAGGLGLADLAARLGDALLGAQAAGAETLFGLLAGLDGHGELDLFLLGQQRLAGRRLQVEAEVIGVVGP